MRGFYGAEEAIFDFPERRPYFDSRLQNAFYNCTPYSSKAGRDKTAWRGEGAWKGTRPA
jgi:hypothetical protein